MVTVDRIQSGISRYLDEQLIPSLSGKSKWIVTGVATLAVQRLPAMISEWSKKPAVKILGVVDENGNVDINSIIESIRPAARSCPAVIDIPFVGSMTITEQDLDMILRYITL